MLLIPFVELIVGPMTEWPRVILSFLFDFPPSCSSIKSLTAFLYGNGLPSSLAVQLVRVCHYGATDEMIHKIQSFYRMWHDNPYLGHFNVYWHMRSKRFVWLNWSRWPLLEFFRGSNNTITGLGIKPRDWIVRRRISRLRGTVHVI